MRKSKGVPLLNLYTPGLGFAYIKKYKLSLATFISTLFFIIILWSLFIFTSLPYIVYLLLLLAWYIGILVLSLKNNTLKESIKPHKWYIILVSIIAVSFLIVPSLTKVLNKFYFQVYTLQGNNLKPTLKATDRIVAIKLYRKEKIQRHDLVTFTNEVDNVTSLSRVIGLPGESIEIIDDVVYINDVKINDPYKHLNEKLPYNDQIKNIMQNFNKLKIPNESYFILGDNRYNSNDSRFIGFIHQKLISQKATKIYYTSELKRIGEEL